MKKVLVIIPCYNEENGIGKVIDDIPIEKLGALGYKAEVLVLDNNSSDRTAEIARSKGAKVIEELRQGKGYAIQTSFRNIPNDINIVVMIDGDNSYKSQEMIRLIEPIDSGFCEVILGTRLSGKISENSMPYFNRVGNWLFTFLVRVGYSGNVTDVCTGYFAWKKEAVDELSRHIEANGFSIEMEMVTKITKLGFNIFSVPISYLNREGKSSLKPLRDGSVILYTWLRNLFWVPIRRNFVPCTSIRKQFAKQNE